MKIKQLISKSGKTRAEICHLSGIPYSTLSDLINERKDILKLNITSFGKLAEALSLSIDKMHRMLMDNYPYFEYPKTEKITLPDVSVTADVCLYEDECFVSFEYGNTTHHIKVCDLNEVTYLTYLDFAYFTVMDFIEENIFREAGETL